VIDEAQLAAFTKRLDTIKMAVEETRVELVKTKRRWNEFLTQLLQPVSTATAAAASKRAAEAKKKAASSTGFGSFMNSLSSTFSGGGPKQKQQQQQQQKTPPPFSVAREKQYCLGRRELLEQQLLRLDALGTSNATLKLIRKDTVRRVQRHLGEWDQLHAHIQQFASFHAFVKQPSKAL
jgi:membrane protein involved in colicin uptake